MKQLFCFLSLYRINDRKLLLFGFLITFLGFTVYLPWGNTYPKLTPSTTSLIPSSIDENTLLLPPPSPSDLSSLAMNYTQQEQLMKLRNSSFLSPNKHHLTALVDYVGCPQEYSWCHDTPQMHLSQLVIGMLCLSIGYPLVLVLTTSIYSKIIGPRSQGLLQSWLAAVGGIARTVGPAIVTYMYVLAGPRWTFLTVDGFLIAALLVMAFCYKRLIPYHVMVLKKNRENHVVSESDIEKTYMLSRLQSCSSAETYLEDPKEFLSVVWAQE